MSRGLGGFAILCAIAVACGFGRLCAASEWGRSGRTLAFYLDCCDLNCDTDFFKREMPFVNWVQDRRDADVEALVRSRTTAQGGTEYTVCFLRDRRSSVASDTLALTLPANASVDAGRRALVAVLKAGIAPDLIGTAAERDLQITVPPAPLGPAGPADDGRVDPWRAWVLGADVNAYLNGERSYRTASIYDDLWARRVTADRKLGFRLASSYGEQFYRLSDGNLLTATRSYSGSVRSVWSLTPHLSAGASGSIGSSSYDNRRLYGRIGPALEYDLYPYGDSAGRLLTLACMVQVVVNHYDAETLYGKTSEGLAQQTTLLAVGLRQPFGTVSAYADVAQYLGKPGMWHADVSGSVTLNLVRGLSLAVSGYWTRLHDQIYLPSGGVTDEQIIAHLRQLATTYQYYVSVGFSYVFGSKVNNVVNPCLTQVYGDI